MNNLETTMKDLPKGVYVKGNSLGVDFRFKGIRRKEIIRPNGVTLIDTAANRAYATKFRENILNAIRAEKMGGKPFSYVDWFPDSKWLQRSKDTRDTQLFGPFINAWYNDKKNKISHTTARKWRQSIEMFAEAHGDLKMSRDDADNEVTVEIFEKWVQGRQSAGIVVKTITNILAPIAMALDMAVMKKKLSTNPIRILVIEKTEDEKDAKYLEEDVDPFDIDHIAKLCKVATGQLLNMITVGFGTGLRLEELFGLAWEDIDFNAGTLTVKVAVTEKQYRRPKTRSSNRTLPLDSNVIEALKRQKEHTYAMPYIDCGKLGKRRIVFYNENSKKPYIETQALRARQWKNLIDKAGIPYRSPGQMRHTFACLCLINGKSEKWVADYLGHTTTAMVQRHYGKLIRKLQEARKAAGMSETPDLTSVFNGRNLGTGNV